MAFKLIWSPIAKLDLKDITAFIAEAGRRQRKEASPASGVYPTDLPISAG